MSKKIVVVQKMDLFPDQIKRLKSLGEVKIYQDMPKNADDWLSRCQNADIICSDKFGLKERIYELKNVFISLPFVGVGWIDKGKIRDRGIVVSRSPGCNKVAVSEWIAGMMLNLLRKLPQSINATNTKNFERTSSLKNKTVCILGKGNVGFRVGKICEAFEMNVIYFQRNDNLIEKARQADVIVNTLSQNSTTENLLDRNFFFSLKQGSYYIDVAVGKIIDSEAMIKSLNENILAGVATDVGGAQVGGISDSHYLKLAKHPKIFVTPHIAYKTDNTARVGYDMMIDNIEAWLKGRSINLVG